MHLGFDRLSYPGDAVMQSLYESTSLAFTAVYLAPAPSQPYTGWMSAVPALRSMGWGLAPVYAGQQPPGSPGSHLLTADQGSADATDAAGLAQSAGLPTGSVLYLDIENGGLLGADQLAYVSAWATGVGGTDYKPGVYCSASGTAAQVTGQVGDLPVWVFHPTDTGPSVIDLSAETPPDPAGSGFAAALVWQYRMSLRGAITLHWTDSSGAARALAQVDLDSATVLDPSNPAA